MNSRVGFGFDVHQLAKNNSLFIGGVKIPHYKGTVAHSDGDVLIHAICDALLGAANLRDIGYHFPDTPQEYKGIDSKELLKKTYNLLSEKSYKIGNIDCTVCLQKPKLSEYIEVMQKNIADILETEIGNISIKATTTEKMGYVGKEDGVSAYSVCLIERI